MDEAFRWKAEMELERKVATEAVMAGVACYPIEDWDYKWSLTTSSETGTIGR